MPLAFRLARKIGKRHQELATNWIPTAMVYGATAFCGLIYFTDWKVIATKIPIYNSKFKTTE